MESPAPKSVPELQIELSDPAKLDLRDILSYTLQMWGEHQLVEYKAKIDGALRNVRQNPRIGHEYDDTALRVIHVGRHQMFYRIDDTTIYVVRVLHENMDPSRHLLQ